MEGLALKLHLKKALRALQVMIPGLQEARIAAHRKALNVLGRTWRPDVGALRFLDIKKPVIVDVGANRGFSIDAFLMLKPEGQIIAFEPLPTLAAALSARYRMFANVTIHRCGLGSAAEEMTIYIPIYRGCMLDSLASLDYDAAATWVNPDRFYFFNSNKLRIEEDRVKISRLDDFTIEPDIIKILAQGHELSIIRGGEATIRRCQPAIIVPARIPEIDTCLKDLGYLRYAFQGARLLHEGEGHTSSWYLRPKHLELFRCQFGEV